MCKIELVLFFKYINYAMDYIAEDSLLLILDYCDLSTCALVCKLWHDLGINIQSRCRRECGLKHPKCMLKRPYEIAALATRYDHVKLLTWLLNNNACNYGALRWFCENRWDLYKQIYYYFSRKSHSNWALPQTDREFIQACHTGRNIVPPFNMTIGALPLRGLAAEHALRNNQDARFIVFDAPTHVLNNVVDVSLQFHNHDLEGIKRVAATTNKTTTSIYIRSLCAHIHICDNPHKCNCVYLCEWIMANHRLESGCHFQYGMLKYHMRTMGIDPRRA